MSSALNIRILTPFRDTQGGELWALLEGLMPVRFEWEEGEGVGNATETILAVAAGSRAASQLHIATPEVWSVGAGRGKNTRKELLVHFTDDPRVPFPFRARSLPTKVVSQFQPLSLSRGEVALARSQSGILWSVGEADGTERFRSAFPLPSLAAGEGFHAVFNGYQFLEMLPLLHWLRRTIGADAFDSPPLRACFIFDDPNLHWPTYGHLNYREVVSRAKKGGYHVALATIPLDTWYTHAGAAQIFRENPEQVSLCVHGNDHTKRELAGRYPPALRQALLQQAIRRVERLEAGSGIEVCRFMVPPHGACSEDMLQALPTVGFEGACISHGSLQRHNLNRAWTRTLGYFPCEIIGGCPVLPRWAMTAEARTTILVAAFLGQPLILRGHHKDVKGGLELLDDLAAFINGLGTVRWCNLSGLGWLNVQSHVEGGTARLRPFGRKVRWEVPKEVSSIILELPPRGAGLTRWKIRHQNGASEVLTAGQTLSLAPKCEGFISAEVLPAETALPETTAPRPTVAKVLRRLLTESRDRLRL